LNTDRSSNPATTQANNLASTLVGAFVSASRNYDLRPPDYRSYEASFFVLDSWRFTPKLTVIYGGRYDLFTPFTEARNSVSNFNFFKALGSTSASVGSVIEAANVNGVNGNAGIKTDYSNFAPRVGFAYSATPKIVVRGGYGLSFFPGNYSSAAALKNAPFVLVYNPTCLSHIAYQIEVQQGLNPKNIAPDCATVPGGATTFDQGLPLPAAQSITSPALSFVAEAPNFRSAMMQQFNLQVEQQIGANVLTIGYVGNLGQHLPEALNNINVPQPDDPANVSTARPLSTLLPNLGTEAYLQSEGVSNYNALQASLQRRFTHGLAFDLNYTWAKALSDITGFLETGTQGYSNANPYQIRQIEYGVAENEIANRFVLSGIYAEQYGKEFKGLKKFALAAWEANVIWLWQSGHPFSIVNNGNGPGGYSNRATPRNNGGPDRPNQIHSANLAHKTLQQSFDVTAFQAQPLGTIGTTQRNILFGPHFRNADVSIFKNFPVTERLTVQFRTESFNISNTPNFFENNSNRNGNTQFGSSSFGKINQTDPNYNPRQLQFALKAMF